MARRDDPPDPSRRLEAVNTPGLEERVQARLAEELGWYDARARKNQRWYRAIKVLQLIAAALVPVMAGMGVSAWITGGRRSLSDSFRLVLRAGHIRHKVLDIYLLRN
jgi:hypothetical protein